MTDRRRLISPTHDMGSQVIQMAAPAFCVGELMLLPNSRSWPTEQEALQIEGLILGVA